MSPAVDRVWPAADDDLWQTARLHVTELHHGLFPRLGQGFVRRWHRAHLRSPSGVLLVACDGVDVIGFLVGAVDQRTNVSWMLERHRTELAFAGGAALILRPWLIGAFLRTRGRRYAQRLVGWGRRSGAESRYGEFGPATTALERVAVLEAVVVDSSARRAGVGTALVEAFLSTVAAAGVDRVELVTKADARGAGRFYERGGWHAVAGHVDRDGDDVVTYRIGTHAMQAE